MRGSYAVGGPVGVPGISIISFDEALDRTGALRREVLLGNGFSIAADPRFEYDRLLETADITHELKAIFAAKRTANFEAVMQLLLAEMHGFDRVASMKAKNLIQGLKEALVNAIHEVHPRRRWELGEERLEHCERFLGHFIGKRRPRMGRVFTTNYDLLLTWVTAPETERRKPDKLFKAFDGFRQGQYDNLGQATVIYLHGALHLFGTGAAVRKLSYADTGVALHDQVAQRLDRHDFPLFVTEGASSLKVPHQAGFLRDARTAFRGTCRQASGTALFTLGHGLGAEDAHILQFVATEKIPAVYLGAFRNDEIEAFQKIAASWIEARANAGGSPLEVFIFDSDGVPWGPALGPSLSA
jgi:hypothetical protein